MRLPKEQLFLVLTVLLLGWLSWSTGTGGHRNVAASTKKSVDPGLLEPAPVVLGPDGAVSRADWVSLPRDPFQEPREWHPLPALDLERPPLEEPAMVPPLPVPGIDLAHLGVARMRMERTPYEFVETGAGGAAEDAGGAAADGPPAEADDADPTAVADEALTLEQEYRRRYDWLEPLGSSQPWYGIIQNEDKYDLADRPGEAVLFARMDPVVGRLMMAGPIDRARIKDDGIHLADNPMNRVEMKLREIPRSTWTPGVVGALLDNLAAVMAEGRNDPRAYERAAEVLAEVREVDPLRPRTLEMLADCHRARLDFEAEIRVLRDAAAGVQSPGLVVRRARWAWRYGARRRALDLLAAGEARFAGDRELALFHGECLLDQGLLTEASKRFAIAEQAATTTAAEKSATLRRLGELFLAQGRLDDAEAQARRILTVDEDDVAGVGLLAAVQYARGAANDAARGFGQLAETATSPALRGAALLGLGLALARDGVFDTARERLVAAGELDPLLQARADAGLAFLYELTGHDQEALESAAAALAHDPRDPWLHYQLGRLQRRTDDLEGALASLRTALMGGAAFTDLFNELAWVSLRTDRAEDAVRYADESLLREQRPETQRILGHALMATGDVGKAARLFGQMPPGSGSFLGRAWCDYRQGRVAAALASLETVVNEMPGSRPEDLAWAADALARIQDVESKERWLDTITWREVGNGWEVNQRYGIEGRGVPGDFRFKGRQRAGSSAENWTSLDRLVELRTFHDLEATLVAQPGHQGRVGFGLVEWTTGAGGERMPKTSLMVIREADGTLRYQSRESVADQRAMWQTAEGVTLPLGTPFRLGIHRVSLDENLFQVLVDGAPVGEPVVVQPWRGQRSRSLQAAFLVAAEPGKAVEASLTQAEIIRERTP